MLDVRRLRILRELSLRATLADVAAALHKSPSSVSQQLSQLEREAGVELLRKSGRRVQLTPAGWRLAEHAGAILDQIERAEAEVAAVADHVAGTVRIAVFQSAALAFMPQLLSTLADQHPRLRVTMSQRVPEEGMHETRTREMDLVIAEEYPHLAAPRLADLDRVPLTTDALRMAVPPDGRTWDSVTSLADATRLPWVMEPPGAASRRWAEQMCRAAGFEPDIRYETDDLEAHIALIEAGNAMAILPDLMSVRRRPVVRIVSLPGAPRRAVFTATRRSLAGSPAIVACRRALTTVIPRSLPFGAQPDNAVVP